MYMLNNDIILPHTHEKNFVFRGNILGLLIFTIFVDIPVCILLIVIQKYNVLNWKVSLRYTIYYNEFRHWF